MLERVAEAMLEGMGKVELGIFDQMVARKDLGSADGDVDPEMTVYSSVWSLANAPVIFG